LADGFHRYHAATAQKLATLQADCRKGTQRDALLFACSANSRHGLPRTNADKRRAVETMLADKEWGGKSLNWISEKCNVSWDLVQEVQKSTSGSGSSHSAKPEKREGKDGKLRETKGWKAAAEESESGEERRARS
jgi:hypothetical protein